MPNIKVAVDLHEKFIKGTQKKMIVPSRRSLICLFTKEVTKAIGCKEEFGRVFITTRCLKHLYDKKPAVEYDSIIQSLDVVASRPDEIYRNLGEKRGSFVFRKKIRNIEFLASIEEVTREEHCEYEIATCFWFRSQNYLNNYSTLWSWGDGGISHRSALDANKS